MGKKNREKGFYLLEMLFLMLFLILSFFEFLRIYNFLEKKIKIRQQEMYL